MCTSISSPHSAWLNLSLIPSPLQLDKFQKAASAAHTFFVANPNHLEMRNNLEKYRRMKGVIEDDFQDRELHKEMHWVRAKSSVSLRPSSSGIIQT